MNASVERQAFHAPGIVADLICRDSVCRFELTIDQSPKQPHEVACVDVILQPKTSSGLPRGLPITLARETVRLRSTADYRHAVGRC